MLETRIEFKGGKPYIWVNGEVHPPMAYTTYFEECGEFEDFIKSGYKMFFINVSFTTLPINNATGFSPFKTGVFEGDEPDYSEFDSMVNSLLSKCPDALIFPRINIAMPRKWIAENLNETVSTQNGGNRESFYSEKFREDGAELLKALVSHIRSSEYSHRIAGYQLCGGLTQEWFHHDCFGSFSEYGMAKFRQWMRERYGVENAPTPTRADFQSNTLTPQVKNYAGFCCEGAARLAEYFASVLKDFINNQQIVGVFYGYNAYVGDYLWGTHGLRHIIASPHIDFFSSPCGYDLSRRLGVDWGDMIPVDSIKHHKKLSFIECDIRTSLTRRMQDSRPNTYPDDIYTLIDANGNKTVWCGPESLELSLSAIRKAYARQLTKGSGVWWFDMWGGWYHHSEIMADIEKMKATSEVALNKDYSKFPHSEVVVLVDEAAYRNLPRSSSILNSVSGIRGAMGTTGIPFDLCMVEDAESVIKNYKCAVFTAPIPTEQGEKAIRLCDSLNVPYLCPTQEKAFFSNDELRAFITSCGVHCYNHNGNVVYVGGGFVGVHSVADGEITLDLPQKYKIKAVLGTDLLEREADKITLYMQKHHTVIFELNNI